MWKLLFVLAIAAVIAAIVFFIYKIFQPDKQEPKRRFTPDEITLGWIEKTISELRENIKDQEMLVNLGVKEAEERLKELKEELEKLEELKKKLP